MSIQLSLFIALAVVAVFTAVITVRAIFRRKIRPLNAGWIVLLWTVFPLSIIFSAVNRRRPEIDPPPVHNPPVEVAADGYIGSQACMSCHPHEHDTWHSSWHRTMTQEAHPSTAMSKIDGVRMEHSGAAFHIDRRGDELWGSFGPAGRFAKTTGTRNPWATAGWVSRPIVLTTGSHHMQMYWMSVTDDDRRMVLFPFAYLGEQERWVPRDSLFLKQPSDNLAMEKYWGTSCMYCHTTFGRFGADSGSEQDFTAAKTRAAEFGIACEACHGPGEDHVTSNRNPLRRYRQHIEGTVNPNIVNPYKLDHKRSSQVCGQCHGIQQDYEGALTDLFREGLDYRPGDDLSKSARWSILRCCSESNLDGLAADDSALAIKELLNSHFWSDGMVRVSGREFNGLLETECYQHGEMTCLSCHVMHQPVDDSRPRKDWANDQLKIGMVSGNSACVQCHESFDDDETLAAHTHHDINSSGSDCYNCHMPHTTYGLVKAIRSHQVDSPDVTTSLRTGRPNACNQCHLDQTLAWTSEHLEQWYEIDQPELTEDERTISASVLSLLRGDAGQRALMAWSFGWKDAQEASDTDWMAPYLAQLMIDPYPAVRLIAHRSLKSIQNYDSISFDYVGNREHRADSRDAVLEYWQQHCAPLGGPIPTVLINKDGEIVQDLFDRLFSQRNNRVVNLPE